MVRSSGEASSDTSADRSAVAGPHPQPRGVRLFLPYPVLPCGMVSDQFERSPGKRFSWLDAMPRRSTGGMREGDDIETLSRPPNGSHLTDHFTQSRDRLDGLSDSQSAHRGHHTRTK